MKYESILVLRKPDVPDEDGICKSTIFHYKNPILVTRNFDPRLPPLGLATLVGREDGIYADIELNAVSKYALDVYEHLTPAVGAIILRKTTEQELPEIQINQVSLVLGNRDVAIKSLGEQHASRHTKSD